MVGVALGQSHQFSGSHRTVVTKAIRPGPGVVKVGTHPRDPDLLVVPSVACTAQTVCPLSSEGTGTEGEVGVFNEGIEVPPAPTVVPSADERHDASLAPATVDPSLVGTSELSVPGSEGPFDRSPVMGIEGGATTVAAEGVKVLRGLYIGAQSTFSIGTS